MLVTLRVPYGKTVRQLQFIEFWQGFAFCIAMLDATELTYKQRAQARKSYTSTALTVLEELQSGPYGFQVYGSSNTHSQSPVWTVDMHFVSEVF